LRDFRHERRASSPHRSGAPCDSGKCGEIRAIWRSLSKNKSSIAVSFIKDRESHLNPN
jgi:hypothetical protein